MSLAVLVGAAVAMPACAQSDATVDYFATPWIFEPVNPLPNPTPSASLAGVNLPVAVFKPTAYSNIFGFATQVIDPRAPAWQLTPRFAVNEILTDNVAETDTHRQWDLTSQFAPGLLLGADTAHLTGLLDVSGVLQQNIHDNNLDQASIVGFATAHATLVPGLLFFNLHASADTLNRAGGGLANPTIQSANTTQDYIITGSPYAIIPMEDFGFAVARYRLSEATFDQNTGPINPLFGVGPISSSTEQEGRVDLKMPGTLYPRLAADLSADWGSDDTGSRGVGNFTRSTEEIINEYQLTRSLSLIGAAGYEWLNDRRYPLVTGEDVVWSVGGRWQPNPDSSLLLVYGRHDLNTDFAGEFQLRLTPFTSVYAAYTDSIGTGQETLIANNDASLLNPAGPVAGITFQEDPVLATLNDSTLAQAGETDTLGVPLGIPLADVENFTPLQNEIFRTKQFRAILYSDVAGSPFSLTVYRSQQISLTGGTPPETTTKGIYVSWSPTLSDRLFGLAQAGYNYVDVDRAHVFDAALGAHYLLSETLSVGLRYDYIHRDVRFTGGGFVQNALTLSIAKNF